MNDMRFLVGVEGGRHFAEGYEKTINRFFESGIYALECTLRIRKIRKNFI